MLLQNRNSFGHAFTKDIAGNTGDKPLQPTFPDKGGFSLSRAGAATGTKRYHRSWLRD
jgi:hypothetical protein